METFRLPALFLCFLGWFFFLNRKGKLFAEAVPLFVCSSISCLMMLFGVLGKLIWGVVFFILFGFWGMAYECLMIIKHKKSAIKRCQIIF